jgi:hypothetical protein
MNGAKGTGQSNPKRWLGIGIRILVTLFFLLLMLALNRCGVPALPAGGTATTTPSQQGAQATLHVEVQPQGASVRIDGLRSGTTPVTLELPAGQHEIRVELDGYEPRVQTVNLAAGDDVVVDGELLPLPTSPGPTVTLIPTPAGETTPLPDLVVKYVQITLETGGDCAYTSTQLGTRVAVENVGAGGAGPFVVDVDGSQQTVEAGLAPGQTASLWFAGYAYGGETKIIIDPASQIAESNKENNAFSQMVPIPTLPPTCTPPPTAPATSTPNPAPGNTPLPPSPQPAAVTMHKGQVTVPTYPFADFTVQARNEIYSVPYAVLDWDAYDASGPVPRDVTYRTLVVENEYLKLTFLPDVGGRLYEVVYKPTGHRETYRNPVLKPSPWGPPEQGWWLAAGGIEWCLPVEEHGYKWGIPWNVTTADDGKSIAVTLHDTGVNTGDRVRARIVVRLEAGAAFFTIQPRIENPSDAALAVKYWTNAMLAPGGQNAPSANLHFVLPDTVTAVTVHSRGDDGLPGSGERMAWPVVDGTDLSRLGNWNRWLGFFEDPAAGEFMAVYDQGYDEGMVRIFPAGVAKGAKGFAFGWKDPIATNNWTDDGSSYVELHGGPASTFGDSVTIPAGSALQWTETWYPVAGLDGLRYANGTAALNLTAGGSQAQVAVAVPRAWSGDVVLLLNDQERWRQEVSLIPGQPLRSTVPLSVDAPSSGQLTLRLETPDGMVAAQCTANLNLK